MVGICIIDQSIGEEVAHCQNGSIPNIQQLFGRDVLSMSMPIPSELISPSVRPLLAFYKLEKEIRHVELDRVASEFATTKRFSELKLQSIAEIKTQ